MTIKEYAEAVQTLNTTLYTCALNSTQHAAIKSTIIELCEKMKKFEIDISEKK